MQKIEYTKMFKLEESHFWFVAKHYFIDSVLSKYKGGIKNILDLGCGTGGVTKHLQKYGKVTGIENYDYAIKLARSRGLNIQKGDLNTFKVKDNSFDLVTLFDVLYHQNIKDEGAILKRAHKSLKKNGLLLITDSALEILTSQHDVVTEGKRRYSILAMKNIVENQHFKIIKASYIYANLFPFVFYKRVILNRLIGESTSDVKPVSITLNKVLLKVLKLESVLLKNLNLPIGSSLIILAVKK